MELQGSPRQLLDGIKVCLDGFDADRVARGERLACAQLARGLASRLTVLSAVLLAKADAARESLQQAGTPTTSWLTVQGGLSKREAAGILHQAKDLAAHPEVAQAAAAGRISVGQARAIGTVLGGLDGLDDGQQAKAEELLHPWPEAWMQIGWRKLRRRCWRRSHPRWPMKPSSVVAAPGGGGAAEPVVGVPPGREWFGAVLWEPAVG